MNSITVIDYGVGNLYSVRRAIEEVGGEARFTESADGIASAERIILPGVGAFADGMAGLRARGLVEPLKAYAASGRPLMGICLGMQMMLDVSEEHGEYEGLGLIPGRVIPVPATGSDGAAHKIPHIGWNEIAPVNGGADWSATPLVGTPVDSSFYFVHSYMAAPADPAHRLADCRYDGTPVAAAIAKGGVVGFQFHPEKSGAAGLAIVRHFMDRYGA